MDFLRRTRPVVVVTAPLVYALILPLVARFAPEGDVPLAFWHPELQEAMLSAARAEGVDVMRPVKVSNIRGGHTPGFTVSRSDLNNGLSCEVNARLVVGADGALSRVRELMAFQTREWDYGHRAIVATRSHNPELIEPAYDAVIEQLPADDFGDVLRNVPGLNVAQSAARDFSISGRKATGSPAHGLGTSTTAI